MTGAKIKDLAPTTCVATAAAENFAPTKPAHKHQRLRLGNIEMLSVHLLVLKFNVLAQPLGDWMTRSNNPQTLMIIGLTPFQIARSPHQLTEDFGEVTGVKYNQSHPVQHTCMDAFDDLIMHLLMCYMSPPDQHICGGEHLRRQAVLRLIKRCSAQRKTISL